MTRPNDPRTMSQADYKKARAAAMNVPPKMPALPIAPKHAREMSDEEWTAHRRSLGLNPIATGPKGGLFYSGAWRPKRSK